LYDSVTTCASNTRGIKTLNLKSFRNLKCSTPTTSVLSTRYQISFIRPFLMSFIHLS